MKPTRMYVLLLAGLGVVVAWSGCRKDAPAAGAPASGPAESMTRPAAKADAIDAEHLARVQASINAGLRFLLSKRNADGGWGFRSGVSHPALTAMTLKALLGHPGSTPETPAVAGGLRCLMKFRQADGGFYVPGEGDRNYITSVAVMALVDTGDEYRQALVGAVKFLRGLQIVPGSAAPDRELVAERHPWLGGFGYGKGGRPDGSSTGMSMEALHQAGFSGNDPAMQLALGYFKRIQNRTEGTEGQAFVVRGADDGGFIYAINKVAGKFVGESKAGSGRRGLRSYGSMTYTGFKSMLYANVDRRDPRVRAAFEWIREYWRLDSNPNMPHRQSKEGLFYYYHVLAKALRAWGQDVITDKRGVGHNWRAELIDVLAARQAADGSWVNADAERWYEGNPLLATCYAVTALEETLKK